MKLTRSCGNVMWKVGSENENLQDDTTLRDAVHSLNRKLNKQQFFCLRLFLNVILYNMHMYRGANYIYKV